MLEQRNEAWAERYGDGWKKVAAFGQGQPAALGARGQKRAARRQEKVETNVCARSGGAAGFLQDSARRSRGAWSPRRANSPAGRD